MLVSVLGIGPQAVIDERHVFYVAFGAPTGVPIPVNLQQSQVATVVSTNGSMVVVLGHYDEVAGKLLPGDVPADVVR